MTALTHHTQLHRSVYSSKKNYQHCRGPLSGSKRESVFQAQNKFSRKKIRGVLEISPVTILTSSERRSKKLLRRNTRRWSARHGLFRECYLPARRRELTERDSNIALRELVEQLDQGKIVRTDANKGIKWGFNPPYAPHFGTVHETMMKAAKRMKN